MADSVSFDGFRLDARGLCRLGPHGRTEPVVLGSRALDLLNLLIRHSGEVVTKDKIMEAVWPGTAVEESNLTVQVSTLRRVLDQGRRQGSCIRTVPGRGYRFVATLSDADEAAANGLPSLALPDKPSIAVLPFVNFSSDPEQQYLGDGIAEDVITALSRYSSVFVIARNSSFTYKERAVDVKQVGRELGVRYVLEGSLRKSGGRVRVTAQLVETETANHVWAERYDRNLRDIFAVQDEITEAATVAIGAAIAEAEQQRAMRRAPENLDAWAAFQQALWHLGKFTANGLTIAEEFFEQAIRLDPRFAGGYWGLAKAQIVSGAIFHRRDLTKTLASAEALTREAVWLDSGDAEARAWLGHILFMSGDAEGALLEIQRALAMSPNLGNAHESLGDTLTWSGRPKEGLSALQKYIRLDPRSPMLAVGLQQIANAHYFCREYEAAAEAARRVIRSYPEYPPPYRALAAALGQLERTQEARRILDEAIAIAPESFDIYIRGRMPWWQPQDHAHIIEGLRKAGWKE
jgi:adenylate cyclase